MQKRKQLRLKKYNYLQNGMYFVTICTQNKQCFFGNIVNDEIKFSRWNSGKMMERIRK